MMFSRQTVAITVLVIISWSLLLLLRNGKTIKLLPITIELTQSVNINNVTVFTNEQSVVVAEPQPKAAASAREETPAARREDVTEASEEDVGDTFRSTTDEEEEVNVVATPSRREEETDAEEEVVARGPKFLFGIFTVLNSTKEESRRWAIRETYLSYYKEVEGKSSTRICSLTEYTGWKSNDPAKYDECQFVYTFVVGANSDGSVQNLCNLPEGTPANYSLSISTSPTIDATKDTDQNDFAFMNIKENMNDGKSPSWFKYGIHEIDTYGLDVDYIVKADSDLFFLPDKFLERMEEKELPQNGKKEDTVVHGGIRCRKGRGSHGRDKLVLKWFTVGSIYFFSIPLARHIATVDHDVVEHYKVKKREHVGEDVSMSNLAFSYPRYNETSQFVGINSKCHDVYPDIGGVHGADVKDPSELRRLYRKKFQQFRANQHKQLAVVAEPQLEAAASAREETSSARSEDVTAASEEEVGETFRGTTELEEEVVAISPHGPKFLFGIFSVLNSTKEESRRHAIRETYLTYYKEVDSKSSTRICSLLEYIGWKSSDPAKYDECQFIYTFVVGGKTDGSVKNLCNLPEGTPANYSLSISNSPTIDLTNDVNENDFAFMNIKENMNDGKSPSWFKYGIHEIDTHGLDVDYIVKADSDLFFLPDKFLQRMEEMALPHDGKKEETVVHGGIRCRKGRGTKSRDKLVLKWFTVGSIYFFSIPLARHIATVDHNVVEHYKDKRTHVGEDVSMSNLAFSYPKYNETSQFVKINSKCHDFLTDIGGAHGAAVKEPSALRFQYRKTLHQFRANQ